MNFTNVKSITIPVNGTDRDVKSISIGGVTVWSKIAALVSISLSGQTTSLNQGSAFSFGGTVTATYSDGSTADVTSSTTFSGYNMSTAGTYTVTASYTENGITATATYQLTVVAVTTWHTVWSGNKSKTVSTGTGSDVDIWTNTATGTATFRFTFSMSASGGKSGSTTQYYNTNGTITTTAPSSPKQMNITYNTNANTILGVVRRYQSGSWIYLSGVKLAYTTAGHKFYMTGVQGVDGSNGSATLTITKIEQYY